MEERPVRHVQHGDRGAAAVPVYQQHGGSPPRDPVIGLPGRGSPTPAVSVAHYGVIEVSSPRTDALRTGSADTSDAAAGAGAGGGGGGDGDAPHWYQGPWGALLCDMLCFKDDFARKTEAVFWEGINPEQR
jgi:hypothetical protein